MTKLTFARLALIITAWALWIGFQPTRDSAPGLLLSGVLTATAFDALLLLLDFLSWFFVRREAQSSFGLDVFKEPVSISYSTFQHHPALAEPFAALAAVGEGPHLATGNQSPMCYFRVDTPVAAHDIRGAIHIADSLSTSGVRHRFDDARVVMTKCDINVVAFGLGASTISQRILHNIETCGFSLPTSGPVDLLYKGEGLSLPDSRFMTGYLVRATPRQYRRRKWILTRPTIR